MISTVPSLSDVVEYQLPEAARAAANSQFIAFINYYYKWLEQSGQSTEFIENIIEYGDIDLSNDVFRQHMISSLIGIIPSYAITNKVLLAKHLGEFLKAKGSLESFKFIMTAVYGEDINMVWNSNKLFRPSDNEYSRTASLAIESATPWENVISSKVTQTYPTPATALISACNSTIFNGSYINWLTLDPLSVSGEFTPSGVVESVWNTINRSWYREEFYYSPTIYLNGQMTFNAISEESRPYNNLIIKQLGSDFRAVIGSLVSRYQTSSYTVVTVSMLSESGTFIPDNQLYIFPIALEGIIYTTESIVFGSVSHSVVDVDITNRGSLYRTGMPIQFQGGSGELVNGYIGDITSGGIDEITITQKGYGYSVGDTLDVITANASGTSPNVVVSTVDGINGVITPTLELNSVSIMNGGGNYKVNDVIEITGGISAFGMHPISLQVTGVNSSSSIQSLNILTSGSAYPAYTNLMIIDLSTMTAISGMTYTMKLNQTGGIGQVNVTSFPSLTSELSNAVSIITRSGALLTTRSGANVILEASAVNVQIIANGIGATASPIISSGVVASITVLAGGLNYKDPVVTIIGNGSGAFYTVNMTAGVITSFTLVSGGKNYTYANVIITEKFGSGFTASLTIQDSLAQIGAITSLSILNRGHYTTLPSCFNPSLYNASTSYVGKGANLSLDFRLLSASISNSGAFYDNVSVSLDGIGQNAIIIPQISNGIITNITNVAGGSGYTYAYVFISGGAGFAGTANISGGSIVSITIKNGGIGYASSNLITIIGDGTLAAFNLTGTGNITNGVITSVSVQNGGKNYYYGTTIVCNATQSGAMSAVFTPVITNGSITSVTTTGGYGYISSDLNNVVISSGTMPSIVSSASGTGGIVNYKIINNGSGYYSQTEIVPLILSASIGTGAVLLPTIAADGSITKVSVLYGGSGYTGASIISLSELSFYLKTLQNGYILQENLGKLDLLQHANGYGAILTPLVFNGAITDVLVQSAGYSYSNGTYAIILGDGIGASIIPIVETGITSVNIIAGGVGYTSNIIINVVDPTGVGAVVRAIVTNGSITGLNIVNKGSGYTNPTLTMTGIGINAILSVSAQRYISSFNIVSRGYDYTYADVIIIGDGSGASAELSFDNLGSIDSVTITNVGSGIVSTPNVVVSDIGGLGAVSSLNIIDGGAGFTVPPILALPVKYNSVGAIIAASARFTTYGSNIGGVSKVLFNSCGAGYNDIPTPIFPYTAILAQNSAFIVGETVTDVAGTYHSVGESAYILLESGYKLLLENGYSSDLDIDDTFFNNGASAIISGFDFARNTIELDISSDTFYLETEDDLYTIISEDGFDIVDMASMSFDTGSILLGNTSNSKATILNSNRAGGVSALGGNSWSAPSFANSTGMLNSKESVLADNNKYQDYAYVIQAGIALDTYQHTLKTTVHPAGFSMFGEVYTDTQVDLGILDLIGYNNLVVMLYILSLSTMYRADVQWSTMSDLYGDFAKFTLKQLDVNPIANMSIQEVSAVVYINYVEYSGTALSPISFNNWNIVNYCTYTLNSQVSPMGDNSLTTLIDSSSIYTAGMSTSIVCNIGDLITIDTMIMKQVSPISYCSLALDTSSIQLNTETGYYTSTSSSIFDVRSVGNYWFVRISVVASMTTVVANIFPASGTVSNFGVSDRTALGRIELTTPSIKNVTTSTSYNAIKRAANNTYVPVKYMLANTETTITIS